MKYKFSNPPFIISVDFVTRTYSISSQTYNHSHALTRFDLTIQKKQIHTILELMRENEEQWPNILDIVKGEIDVPQIAKQAEDILDKQSYQQYSAPVRTHDLISMVSMILCDISIMKKKIPRIANQADYIYLHSSVCNWHCLPQNMSDASFLSIKDVYNNWRNNPNYFREYVVEATWCLSQKKEIKQHRFDILRLLFENLRNDEIMPGIENHIIKSYTRSFLGYGSLNHSQSWHYVQPPVPLSSEITCQQLQSLLKHAPLITVELLQMRNMCSPEHVHLFHQKNLLDDALTNLKKNNYELGSDDPFRRINVAHIICLHEMFPKLWNENMNIEDIKKWSLRGQHWIDPPSRMHKQRAEWENLVVAKKLYILDDNNKACDCRQGVFEDIITFKTIKGMARFKFEPEEQKLAACMTPIAPQKYKEPLTAETVNSLNKSPEEEDFFEELEELDESEESEELEETVVSKKRALDTCPALTIASDPRTWISFEVNNKGYGWGKVFVTGHVRQTKLKDRKTGARGKPNKNFDNVQWCIPVCYETEDFKEEIWLPEDLENIRNVETGAKRSKY